MSLTPQCPISVQGVRSRMVGMGAWLRAAATSVERYDDLHIQAKVIPARVREFERLTNFRVNARQIVTGDDGTYTGQGVAMPDGTLVNLPVVESQGIPYRDLLATQYFSVVLYEKPVQLVQRVRIRIQNINIYQVPLGWVSLDKIGGKINLLPANGPALVSNVAGLAVLSSGFSNGLGYVPNAIQCDYICGLPVGWQDDLEWADLGQALEEFVASQVYQDVQNLADAGLISKSVSGDGSGESMPYDRFLPRISQLEAKVAAFITNFDAKETPVILGWV